MVEETKAHHTLLFTVAPGRMGQRSRQVRDVSLKGESSLKSGTTFVQAIHLALTECVGNTTMCDNLSWNSLTNLRELAAQNETIILVKLLLMQYRLT
jgi:hypothetical protein